MSTGTFTYFAYGSNMLSARLRNRCPSAKPISGAELPGYELRWHKYSRKDGSGKCNIVPSPSSRVLGVLYRIDNSDEAELDRFEGLGNGYKKINISMTSDGSNVTVKTYQATQIDKTIEPYSWYKALVIAGAKEHGLPKEYIEQLSLVVSKEDPDQVRHHREVQIIGEELR